MRKSLIFEINFQHQGSQLSCLISTVPRKFGFFVALYVNVKMPFTRGRPLRQQMMELRAVHALPRPPSLPSSKKICEIESSWIVLSIFYTKYFLGVSGIIPLPPSQNIFLITCENWEDEFLMTKIRANMKASQCFGI